jgi:chromosomal replication initiator protein
VSPERIEQVVAAAFDLDRRRLASPQRAARLVRARHIAMFLMRKRLGLSYGEIGIRYERDHSTVLHAVRAIEHRIACDPEVRRLVSALEDQF